MNLLKKIIGSNLLNKKIYISTYRNIDSNNKNYVTTQETIELIAYSSSLIFTSGVIYKTYKYYQNEEKNKLLSGKCK
tara:strand:+ start:194 stop:424 length:231 start_codon:yes stop_codon:yes gene_type:complete